ncbi:unnamed protein product [Somion occarium]|uniref:Uncharacterized protein n=1 Tax=Somion occarium TaxID=3059160 RepID=A0ABP1DNE4_9APHY
MPPPSPSLPSSPTSATTSTTSLTPTTPNGFMTSDDYSTASQRSSPSRTMMLSAIPLRQTITLVTQDQKSFVSASSSNLPTVYEDSERRIEDCVMVRRPLQAAYAQRWAVSRTRTKAWTRTARRRARTA